MSDECNERSEGVLIMLQDIAYVRSGVCDLDSAVRFAVNIVGLQDQGREEGVAYLRADHRHHCLSFVEGQSGVLSSAFSLRDEDELASAEKQLRSAGVDVAHTAASSPSLRR